MTKVCHLTTVHKNNDVRIFEKECRSLAAHNYEVSLIALGEVDEEDFVYNVRRITLGLSAKNRIYRIIVGVKKVAEKAAEVDADIYHIHDPELLLIALILKRKGKTVVFDSHEFYGEQIKHKKYVPAPLRKLLAYGYVEFERYMCGRIDGVVQVCSLNGVDYFENRAKRTVFISNASLPGESVRLNNTPIHERKFASHIGTLSYNRGTTNIVKAAHAANVGLILGGRFASSRYFERVKKLDEFSNVKFLGFVSPNEIKNVLNSSFVGLSTLLHVGQYDKIDTFPTKVFDYMAAGIPVIVSNTRYAKEMIEKYRFGICVDPSNINEIADAIDIFNSNRDLAEEYGENGRKAFLDRFNWRVEEQKLISFYESLQSPNLGLYP